MSVAGNSQQDVGEQMKAAEKRWERQVPCLTMCLVLHAECCGHTLYIRDCHGCVLSHSVGLGYQKVSVHMLQVREGRVKNLSCTQAGQLMKVCSQ